MYRKRDRSDVYIEYNGEHRMWVVRSAGALFGEDSSFATLTSPEPLPLELVAGGLWRLFDGSDMVSDNAIRVSVCAVRDISIEGASGAFAELINGNYRPSVQAAGATTYCKLLDSSVRIAFENEAWRISRTSSDSVQILACLSLPKPWPLETAFDCAWLVFDGTTFHADARVIAVEKIVHSVRLCGAKGPVASALNGLYSPVLDALTGDTFYLRKDGLHCIEYWWEARQWQAKKIASRGQNYASAYVSSRFFRPLELVTEECWRISDGQSYRREASLRVTAVGTRVIMLHGASGNLAEKINGRYYPTEEVHNDATLYVKLDDPAKCIEWMASNRTWQVKPTSKTGKNKSWARLWCEGPLPLDRLAADSRYVWQQYDSMGWGDRPDLGIALPALHSIRIYGAVGPFASQLNGTYDPSPWEVSGGASVYYKRPDGKHCIEYLARKRKWQAKPLEEKGCDRASAFLPCPTPIPIEEVVDSVWMVHAGTEFQVQPTVKVLIV